MANGNTTFWSRSRTTLVGGLFLLLPLTVVIMVVLKIMAYTRPLTAHIADLLGMTYGIRLLEVALLLLICLVAGLFVRSERVGGVRDWLEDNVLSMIPGYSYIRMRMQETLGQDEHALERAVLVRLDDAWSPARLIETGDDGTSVVFIPDTPQGNSGAVLVVESERVQPLNVPYARLVDSVRNYGHGLQAIRNTPRAGG